MQIHFRDMLTSNLQQERGAPLHFCPAACRAYGVDLTELLRLKLAGPQTASGQTDGGSISTTYMIEGEQGSSDLSRAQLFVLRLSSPIRAAGGCCRT
jgi:hypothetical protein